MSGRSVLILAICLLMLGSGAVLGAEKFSIDAPGGWSYEKDGAISAKGTKNKQLVVVLDDIKITADLFSYNQAKRTGQAKGKVYWRQVNGPNKREMKAALIGFNLRSKLAQCEGGVSLSEAGTKLNAESVQVDLANGVYTANGRPALIDSADQTITGRIIVFDAGHDLITASGQTVWTFITGSERRTITAGALTYDLRAHQGVISEGVKATVSGLTFSCDALRYEAATDVYRLTGKPALVRKEAPASEPEEIQAGSMTIAIKESRLHAEGDVRAASGGFHLEASAADADTALGDYLLTGNPARAASNWGLFSAAKLHYSRAAGKLTADGDATWLQSKSDAVLRAASILYDSTTGTSEAYGGVTLTAEDGLAAAERLRYEEHDGNYLFSGGASVTRPGMKLSADEISYQPSNGLYALSGESVLLRDDLKLTAAAIIYQIHEGLVTATGHVAAGTGRGSFTAGRLTFSERDGIIHLSEQPVISGDDLTLRAAEITYRQAEGVVTAAGGVSCIAGDGSFTAERLTFHEDDGSYLLTGGASLQKGPIKLSASEISARTGEGLVTAAGGVTFTDNVYTGTCDTMIYDNREEKTVILRGHVRVTYGADVVTGEEISYNLRSRRIKVKGPATLSYSDE